MRDGSVIKDVASVPGTAFVRWSPDGQALDYITLHGGGSEIWRLPLNSRAPRRLVRFDADQVVFFAWNESGSKLAYIFGRVDSDVVLFHRATRK
ncbi:MAG: hypothetical protein JOZ62_20625 [Acidobacteriaceae bacterium]|nr:hypothetical protein [Acidobacteriaceae bacterium]